jgi:3-deoxy-7-phosphoheptulonate synthase
VQKETYLPIIVDPSHAAGRRDLIYSLSCAATAVGASGLVIEVHYNPAEALVDAQQMITPDELERIITDCKQIRKVVSPDREKVQAG